MFGMLAVSFISPVYEAVQRWQPPDYQWRHTDVREEKAAQR